MTIQNNMRVLRSTLMNGSSQVIYHSRRCFSNEVQEVKQRISNSLKKRVFGSIEFVDDTIGVTEVSKAQDDVSTNESEFLLARKKVQLVRSELEEQQKTLNLTRKELDRTDRANENYLSFVSNEHKILLQVQELMKKQNEMENAERIAFNNFSSAIRSSHEKERSRVERTKYWSIIASVSGTILGFVLSSFVTHYRLKKIEDASQQRWMQSSKYVEEMLTNFHSKTMEEISTLSTPPQVIEVQKEDSTTNAHLDEVLDQLQNHLKQIETKCDKALLIIDETNQEFKRVTFDNANQILDPVIPSTVVAPNDTNSNLDTKLSEDVLLLNKEPEDNPTSEQSTSTSPENEPEINKLIDISSVGGSTPPFKQYIPLLIFVGSGALLIYSMIDQF